jgi:hypothetical protein
MQQITGAGPPVLGLLREAYRVTREVLAGLPVTGRKWKRPPRECPSWCARDHRCTAQHGYPSGEHRSPANTWTPTYGRMVAARTRTIDGTEQLELTTRVTLSSDGNTALAQGINVPLVVSAAIQTCLAEVDLMIRHRTALTAGTARSLDGHELSGLARTATDRRQLPRRAA